MFGGDGDDTFLVEGTGDGFDRFFGGDGTDRIVGTDGDDRIGISSRFDANSSVEEINGGAGFNTIEGGSSNDTLDFSHTTLIGIAEIRGNAGNDTIVGSSGDDVIVGGANNDTLSGGGGNDTFVFNSGDGRDRVVDFQLGDILRFEDFLEASLEIQQRGGDAVIRFVDDNVTVTLRNVDSDEIGYSVTQQPDDNAVIVQFNDLG